MNAIFPASLLACGQNTLLHPSLSMGLAVTDRKTGSRLAEKRVSLSGSGTVLECLGALLAFLLALRILCMMLRLRRKCRMRRTKGRRSRSKIMSES